MSESLTPDTPTPAQSDTSALSTWKDQVREASAHRQPLWIRGGGTKSFLAGGGTGADSTLDTRTHRGIVAYEPTELVITARAGTPLAELEAALAQRGQCLAFEPPHFGEGATIGGVVAAGLSGPARASVGGVRDFILGAHLLNGRGEVLQFGGQVMKNVAGYDVSRLLAGSMGSLGVLVQVSLKVLPVAPAEATLRFVTPQADALRQLARWRGQPLPLNASCWVEDTTTEGHPTVLYVRLRGAVAAVESACSRMVADLPGERLDTASVAADWVACREQTLPFFKQAPEGMGLWRLSVAPTAPPCPWPWPTLMEWHGGQRWMWAPVEAGPSLREWATQQGGHATLFRTPAGTTAPNNRFTAPAAAILDIHQRLKAAFDPAGVFNPGIWGFGL